MNLVTTAFHIAGVIIVEMKLATVVDALAGVINRTDGDDDNVGTVCNTIPSFNILDCRSASGCVTTLKASTVCPLAC